MRVSREITAFLVVALAFVLAMRWTISAQRQLMADVRAETEASVESRYRAELDQLNCQLEGLVVHYEGRRMFCIPSDSFPVTSDSVPLP